MVHRRRCVLLEVLLAAAVVAQVVPSALGQCTCNSEANREVMLELYAATGGGQWTTPRDTSKSICVWAGVELCNAEFIEKINLRGRNMRGNITAFSFAALTSLKQLDMSNNAGIEGSIHSIPLPSSLTTLSLAGTTISGTIPDTAWRTGLPSLVVFDCTGCQLSGTLPNTWCAPSTPRLRALTLAANRQMSGTLPATLALCPLTAIDVSLCNITGTIPAAWGDGAAFASSLNSLHLGSNRLTGAIPPAWFAWEAVLTLNVSWNQLTGGLPPTVTIPFATVLDVSHNELSGSLPSNISDTVQEFVAANNLFTGELPPAIPKALLRFDVSHNALSGSLPAAWKAPSITSLAMRDNRLTGTLPSSWTNLASSPMRTLDLSSNQLTGRLPGAWGNVSETLNLSVNAITLPLPAWETSASVGTLDLGYNNLSGVMGVVPSPLSLHTLVVNNNAITRITAPLTSMLALRSLSAANNSITGFPASLPYNLATLDLRSNAIAGTLPLSYAQYGGLTTVLLSNNRITGGLPGVWRWIYALRYLALSNNSVMQLPRVPPAWCPPLRAKAWTLELSGNAIRFPSGVVDAMATPTSVADWIVQWCPTWTTSVLATDTRARISASSTASASATATKFVTRLWLTATRTQPSRTWNASTPTQNASTSFTESTSASRQTPQASHSPSFSAAPVSATNRASLSQSLPWSISLAATHTRLGASRSATGTLGISLSAPTSSLTASSSSKTSVSVPRLSVSNTSSVTATLKCDDTTNVSNAAGLFVDLYRIYTASTHTIVVTWSRPVMAVYASTSWGSVSMLQTPDEGNTTVSTNRTELILRAPSAVDSFTDTIVVHLTVAVKWTQYARSIVCFRTAAMDVVLGASEPPTPEAVRAVATVAAIAAVGPLSGAAAAAVQQSMLQLSLSQCVFSDTAQLPISDNPTRLMIGDAVGAAYRGSAIGNMMLIVVTVMLATIVAVCHHLMQRTPTLLHSLAFLRMPGRSIIVVAMLLQPMVSSGIALLSLPGGSGPGDVVLAMVTLGFLALTVARFLVRTLQVVRDLRVVYQQPCDWLDFLVGRRLRWVPRDPSSEHNIRVAAGSLAELAPDDHETAYGHTVEPPPSTEAPPDDDAAAAMALLCAQRYDLILGRQVPGREWFFGVEMAAAALYGVVGGLRPETVDGCRQSQIFLCCVSGVYALLILALRPFAAVTDLVFHTFIACLSLGSGIMMVVAYTAASDVVSFVQIGCLLLRGVLHAVHLLRMCGATRSRYHDDSKWDELGREVECAETEAVRDVDYRLDTLPSLEDDCASADTDLTEILWFLPPPPHPSQGDPIANAHGTEQVVVAHPSPYTPSQRTANDILLAICEDVEMLRRGQERPRPGGDEGLEDADNSNGCEGLSPYLPSSLVERRNRLKNAIQLIAAANAHA